MYKVYNHTLHTINTPFIIYSEPADCSLGTGSSIVVTFDAGDSRMCVDVGITNDNLKETLEICELSLSMVSGSSIGIDQDRSSSDICITDDDRKSLTPHLIAFNTDTTSLHMH